MAPMRAHKKSRLGCLTCKGRRIKCDEVHPSCGNCTRRTLGCVWSSSESSSTPSPSSESSSPTSDNRLILPGGGALFEFDSRPQALDMKRFKLMHHYTSKTYRTLCTRAEGRQVWQVIAPRLALQNEFLMHSIMAIASLHLSRNSTASPMYLDLAYMHYQSACDELSQIPKDPEAVHLSKTLLALYLFASPSPGDLSIYACLESVRSVNATTPYVTTGRLAPLFHMDLRYSARSSLSIPELPDSLYNLTHSNPYTPDADEIEDICARTAYKSAVVKLYDSYEILLYPEFEEVVTFIWPCGFDDTFTIYLKEKRPRALVLLAYYCAMLTTMADRFWWIGTRAHEDLDIIVNTLDEKWMHWIEWPLQVAEQTRPSQENLVLS